MVFIFISNLITIRLVYDEFWSHVKEIANAQLLVSVHNSFNASTKLEVLDVTQKGRVRKIYSSEAVSGCRNHHL